MDSFTVFSCGPVSENPSTLLVVKISKYFEFEIDLFRKYKVLFSKLAKRFRRMFGVVNTIQALVKFCDFDGHLVSSCVHRYSPSRGLTKNLKKTVEVSIPIKPVYQMQNFLGETTHYFRAVADRKKNQGDIKVMCCTHLVNASFHMN